MAAGVAMLVQLLFTFRAKQFDTFLLLNRVDGHIMVDYTHQIYHESSKSCNSSIKNQL